MPRPTLTIPPHPPIRFDGFGEPDPDDLAELETDEIRFDGALYMSRYYLSRSPVGSIRLHHLHASDPGRDLHDHPWPFVSLILTGGYRETTAAGDVDYLAPTIVTRPASLAHRLEILADTWTLVTTGSICRTWGFQTPTGWIEAGDYPDFERFG